jgi:hypothetical protein
MAKCRRSGTSIKKRPRHGMRARKTFTLLASMEYGASTTERRELLERFCVLLLCAARRKPVASVRHYPQTTEPGGRKC